MRRTAVTVLAMMLAGLAATLAPAAHATSWTPSSYAARLVSLLNQTRQQHGLPALSLASGTSQVAASWTSHMASTNSLAHNPDLAHDLETHGSPDWTAYGENVGDGPSNNPDALFQAYMNSTEHRDNILSRSFRYMGVGVVFSGDIAWNTFDFVDRYHSSTTTTSSPAPSKPKHRTTVRTTTAPAPTTAVSHPPTAAAVVTAAPKPKPAHHRHRPRTRVDALIARATPSPENAVFAGGSTAAGVVALPRLPGLPQPMTPATQVLIAVAGAMVGFVGVKWAQVVRSA